MFAAKAVVRMENSILYLQDFFYSMMMVEDMALRCGTVGDETSKLFYFHSFCCIATTIRIACPPVTVVYAS